MTGCCPHGIETCGSVKLRLFLDWLRKRKLREDCLAWSCCHLSLTTATCRWLLRTVSDVVCGVSALHLLASVAMTSDVPSSICISQLRFLLMFCDVVQRRQHTTAMFPAAYTGVLGTATSRFCQYARYSHGC